MTSPISVVKEGSPHVDEQPGSVLAQLRARAAAQRKTKHVELEVGGAFGDALIVRYGLLPVDGLERYSELQGNVGNVSLAIEMMVSTCETLLWREGDVVTDLHVTFSSDLWSLMGWPLDDGMTLEDVSPRETVITLFGDNAMALGTHVEHLVTWMRNPGGDAPGEASGARS